MKSLRRPRTVWILCAVAALAACAPADEAGTPESAADTAEAPAAADEGGPTAELPPPEAEAVWAHLGDESYTAEWGRWPGTDAHYEGTEPHGSLLTTYVNREAAYAFETDAPAMPPGAMVVKENYSADGVLGSITVMYKVEGFNPEAGDWFWAKYLPDGSVDGGGTLAGTPASCIECHAEAAGNDYLRTGPLDSGAGGAVP